MSERFGYLHSLCWFDRVVAAATSVSFNAEGRQTDSRRWWSSVLFTKFTTSCVSLLVLLPFNRFVISKFQHWDSSTAVSLTRNLIETYLLFFYFVVDDISETEWRCRLTLVQLHDCCSRTNMFKELNLEYEQLKVFSEQQEELRESLRNNEFFKSLDRKKQKTLLRGKTIYHLTRDDLLARINIPRSIYRGWYRFFSQHVHSLPMSFYRMGDGDQGRGLESEFERGTTKTAIEIATPFIARATIEMIRLFPDTEAAVSRRGLRAVKRFAKSLVRGKAV